jgi:hypothetical protein
VVAHTRGKPRDQRFGLDPVAPDDRHRNALRFLEDCRKEIGGLDGVPPRSARVEERQLEQQLGRRRHAQVVPASARQNPEVFLERLQDLVRIEAEVAHDLPEHVPLDLREGQADVLVGQQRVFAPAGFVQRPVHHTFGGLSQLVLRDVKVFHGRSLRSRRSGSGRQRPRAGSSGSALHESKFGSTNPVAGCESPKRVKTGSKTERTLPRTWWAPRETLAAVPGATQGDEP